MSVAKQKSNSVDTVAIRQLDQIQEDNGEPRGGRVAAMVMASFGGATIVFAALALMRSPEPESQPADDPLGKLVAAGEGEEDIDEREKLDPDDVTFPGVLSDQDAPTTAMEAVRGGDAGERHPDEAHADDRYDGPPPATDELPVVPLPAQELIEPVPRPDPAPSDTLGTMARRASREPEDAELAEPGEPGGYQLQVASFRKPEDAQGFALELRRRGHEAHVVAAHVKDRGLWHRVRIGPFKYRRSAEIYRQDFEAKESMVSFVVDKPETKIEIEPAE